MVAIAQLPRDNELVSWAVFLTLALGIYLFSPGRRTRLTGFGLLLLILAIGIG
jgi:hypothetical protein